MTFDKSKVYTALNADELHAGDTVYVADNLHSLRKRVESENITPTFNIISIRDDDSSLYRFCTDRFDTDFALAYPVKRR